MKPNETLDMETQAQKLKLEGKYMDALRLRQELETIYDRCKGCVIEQSRNLNYIAFLAIRTGVPNEAERAARKCLELYRPVATDQKKLATYLMMLSSALAENKQFEEAVAVGDEAVGLFTQIHGKNSRFVEYRKREVERMRNSDSQPYLSR